MIGSQYRSEIQTVLVTTAGRALDRVSFAGKAQAEAYKRGVRRWARERGVAVQVRSQVVSTVRGLPIAS